MQKHSRDPYFDREVHVPEAALYAALITSAIKDILVYERRQRFSYKRASVATKVRNRKDRLAADAARQWIGGAPSRVTFEFACEVTDIDPAVVRFAVEQGIDDLDVAWEVYEALHRGAGTGNPAGYPKVAA